MVFGGFPSKRFQIPILMGGPDLEFAVKWVTACMMQEGYFFCFMGFVLVNFF